MNQADRERFLREANEAIGIAADEHRSSTGHLVVVRQGEGWGCTTCDPDLFIEGTEQDLLRPREVSPR